MERFTADGEDWTNKDWLVFDNEECYCCFGPTTQLNAVDKARELNNAYKEKGEVGVLKVRIAELENPWISVEDRLPDVGKWYLCWSRNQVQIIFLDTAEPIIWLQDGDYLENVTHWMPLPEPLKGQE